MKSIDKQKNKQKKYKPTGRPRTPSGRICPNVQCGSDNIVKLGTYLSKKYGRTQRFRCKDCGRSFN